MRKLTVQMDEVVEAMTGHFEDGFEHYLHLTTGEVVMVVPPEYRVRWVMSDERSVAPGCGCHRARPRVVVSVRHSLPRR